MSGPASGIPAGGPGHGPASGIAAKGTRPPFTPGNLLGVKHGAGAPGVYGPLAEQLAAGLLAERPDLGAYPAAVAAWATAEAVAALMRRHVAEVGAIDPETNEPRPGTLTWLAKFERAAAEARRPLGLDPLADAVLTKTRAEVATLTVDLVALAERGRQALAGRAEPADLAGDVLAEQLEAYGAERAAQAATWAEREAGR